MGVLTAEHVAIAELIVYIPTALVTIWVVLRHGTHKQLGWIYLAIFSIMRIAGSVLEIMSVHNPSNTNDQEWALILQSVGLSPLLLSTLGLLKRVFDEVSSHIPSTNKHTVLQGLSYAPGVAGKLANIYTSRATAPSRRSRVVQLLHIPALIALILSISGGTDLFSTPPDPSGQTEVRAAIVLYLLIYLCAWLLWAVTLPDFSSMQRSQTRIYLGVMVALPLIAVRLLYSLIGAFGHRKQFDLVDGDIGIRLGMATVEEFLVVVLYAALGVITPRAARTPQTDVQMQMPEGEGAVGPGRDARSGRGYTNTYVGRDVQRGRTGHRR